VTVTPPFIVAGAIATESSVIDVFVENVEEIRVPPMAI
jgi:hypothetical protein